MPSTLIVIPAFNEEAALATTIDNLQFLSDDYEVLIVNDGSADQTRSIAESTKTSSRLKVHVLSLAINCGIGVAVQTGYLFAVRQGLYQYVIQFDADGQHPAEDIPRLVEACESQGLDLCVGSRFLDLKRSGYRSTFLRRMGIRFFARLVSGLSRTKVTDPTSGFRCAGPRAWKAFARRYPDDYPEPETLFWCARHRMKVGELAVSMSARQGGISSIRIKHSVYYMLKVTIAIFVDRIRRKEPLQ